MGRMIVEFKWSSKDMGKEWFNVDNLRACLFTKEHTKEELLRICKKNTTKNLKQGGTK